MISQEFSAVYRPVFTTDARYIHIWGGRARGGSHFATDYYLHMITKPGYFRGGFMRAIFGDIKGSLWQDLKDRIDALCEKGQLKLSDFKLNEQSMTAVYLPTGNSIISKGFKKSSGSSTGKLKSLAGLTHIAIEEAEEVGEDDFNKLDDSLRTNKVENIQVILLFNPPSKNHWLIKRHYILQPSEHKGWYRTVPKTIPGFLSIHTTYEDNWENVNDTTRKKYQAYGDPRSALYNEDFYYRDVLGLVSEGKKGRILTRCFPITNEFFEALPFPSFYGLDFGYSEDPVALPEIKFHNNKAYVRRIIYEPGLTDDVLATRMGINHVSKKDEVVADSSEPKSIATLRRFGYNVTEAEKGPDSILNGIKYLQSIDLLITEDSKEIWEEVENYTWQLDKDKNPTNTPIDDWNHAIDAIRYALVKRTQRGKSSGLVVSKSRR